jgi:hypothetical protein
MTAALTTIGGPDSDDALTAHAKLYAGASTPLSAVEIAREPTCHSYPWGSIKPLEFAPSTLAEARKLYGPDLVIQAPSVEAVKAPVVQPERKPVVVSTDSPMEFLEALANGTSLEEMTRLLDDAFAGSEPLTDPVDVDDDLSPVQRPDLVDRLREEMKALSEPPATWDDLVLTLMRQTHIAANVIDQVLSTPMGMTAISQAGFFHLHPGAYPDAPPVPEAR